MHGSWRLENTSSTIMKYITMYIIMYVYHMLFILQYSLYCILYSDTLWYMFHKSDETASMIVIYSGTSILRSAFQWCLSWLGLSWNDLGINLTLTVKSVSSGALPVTWFDHVAVSRDNWTSFLSDFEYEKVWKANTCKYPMDPEGNI